MKKSIKFMRNSERVDSQPTSRFDLDDFAMDYTREFEITATVGLKYEGTND